MFGIGKDQKDPLADAKAAERWYASLPGNDPVAIQHDVQAELARLTERSARRTPQGLEAVFRVDLETQSLRRTLSAQYLEHASRSSRIESQLWQALFDLTQGFLACYAAFERELSAHAQSSKWQALLPELLARQIQHLGLDARIRLYRYEQWIPAKWAELHALFTLACSRQIERRHVVVSAQGETTTVEHEYLVALILQLVNSGNLTPKHVDWGRDPSRRVVPAAAAHARAVVGHLVLRGPRQPDGASPPHAGSARRPRAVPRHASAARAPAAERRDARAEDQEPAAVRPDRAPERAARALHEARLPGRPGVQAVRPARRAHVGSGHRRRDRRVREDLGLPARGGTGADAGARSRQELRRDDGARGVRARAQRARPAARAGAAAARQLRDARAGRGK